MIPLPELDFRRTPVTLVVTAVAAAIEIASTLNPELRDHLYMDLHLGMLSPVWSGEVWRPLTTTILHGSPLHAAFNIYVTLVFGQVLETRFGSLRFLGLLVPLGYVSSMVQFLVSNVNTPLDGQQDVVGLSGIVYGLFGFLWIGRRWRPEFRDVCNDFTVQILVAWFFICIVLTYTGVMKIANVAHGTGCAAGVLYGLAAFHPQHRKLWLAAATVASLLVITTVFAAPGHPLYEKHRAAERFNRQLRQEIQRLQQHPPEPQPTGQDDSQ